MNLMNVDYTTKIPNNVNLTEDRQVLKALEGWHPGYLDWWNDMGPEGFQDCWSICAPRSASIRRAGRNSITSACRNIAGAFCWRRRTANAR